MSEMSRRMFLARSGAALSLGSLSIATAGRAEGKKYPGEWPSTPPANCPLQFSRSLRGLFFTGRHQEYANADTWYLSWASDDVQYSPFADGKVLNSTAVPVAAACDQGFNATTGYAKILGNDPLRLQVTAIGKWKSSGMPYGGRYPCANIVHNGTWYYGTYCCDINLRRANGVVYNWAWLGPYLGCRYSTDHGETWVESPCKPWAPLFREDIFGKGPQLSKRHFEAA